jgi:hypothetical protein
MSGIKLTLLLPILNEQIKHTIQKISSSKDDGKLVYSLILCHSNGRSAELADFAKELVEFCKDVVDVVSFGGSMEIQDIAIEWRQRTKIEDGSEEMGKMKSRNKVVIVTPDTALKMFEKNLLPAATSECFSLVIDKIDLH